MKIDTTSGGNEQVDDNNETKAVCDLTRSLTGDLQKNITDVSSLRELIHLYVETEEIASTLQASFSNLFSSTKTFAIWLNGFNWNLFPVVQSTVC